MSQEWKYRAEWCIERCTEGFLLVLFIPVFCVLLPLIPFFWLFGRKTDHELNPNGR